MNPVRHDPPPNRSRHTCLSIPNDQGILYLFCLPVVPRNAEPRISRRMAAFPNCASQIRKSAIGPQRPPLAYPRPANSALTSAKPAGRPLAASTTPAISTRRSTFVLPHAKGASARNDPQTRLRRLAPPVPVHREGLRERRLPRPACRNRDPYRRRDRQVQTRSDRFRRSAPAVGRRALRRVDPLKTTALEGHRSHHRLHDSLPLSSRRHGPYQTYRANVMSFGMDSESELA